MISLDALGIATAVMAVVITVFATITYLVYSLRFTHSRRGPRAAYTFTALLASLVVALVGIGEIASAAGSAAVSTNESKDCTTNAVAHRQVQSPTLTFPPVPSPPSVVFPSAAPFTPPPFPRSQLVPVPTVAFPPFSPTPPIELNAQCGTFGAPAGATAAHGGVLILVAALAMAFHANVARRMLEKEMT